jgi:EAL domain-containing protein (putative c-di-GMP-specific phosphodiesterase class I)
MGQDAALIAFSPAEVDAAIENGELAVAYQAVVDLDGLDVVGVEALARWHHPVLGSLQPDTFIAALEVSGAVIDLDHWVRQRMMCDLRDLGHLTAYVNISVQEVNADLAECVVLMAGELRFPLDRLVIEVSEGSGLGRLDTAAEHLNLLRQHGVRVALDDVGSGDAGLTRLVVLPLDVVKIDRSLIARLGVSSGRAERVIHSLLELAHALDATTIAEGVESQAQADILVDLGCRYAQGFWHSRPVHCAAIRTPGTTVQPLP